MKIVNVTVTNLFRIFNHPIHLNVEEHITMIHGPNGFGKTAILRMIDGLFNANYSIFRQIPFDEFRVGFDDDSSITVVQERITTDSGEEKWVATLRGPSPDMESFDLSGLDKERIPFPLGLIEDTVPELIRTGPTEWVNRYDNETLSLEDVVDNFSHLLPEIPFTVPNWLKELRKSVYIHFIKTDRLVTHRPMPRYRHRPDRFPQTTSTVVQYSKELALTIQETLAKSVELSSSLDRSFPSRLMGRISRGEKPDLTEEQLRQDLVELEENRSRLMAAGLLEQEEAAVDIPDESLASDMLNVLSVYVKDVQEKLNLFDEDLTKIELMQRMINRRFLYKEFRISKQHGFIFQTPRGSSLSPQSLSSGEQHEIVLLYELLFQVQPNSLILIDEPEISLHIAWQQQFIDDLLEITKIADFDVIIATHSPDIINDRWDLTVQLNEPE